MIELITYLAKNMVSRPQDVTVTESEAESLTTVKLKVAPDDLNIIIGKRGRTAKAMRSLLIAASIKKNRRYHLEILQDAADANNEH